MKSLLILIGLLHPECHIVVWVVGGFFEEDIFVGYVIFEMHQLPASTMDFNKAASKKAEISCHQT